MYNWLPRDYRRKYFCTMSCFNLLDENNNESIQYVAIFSNWSKDSTPGQAHLFQINREDIMSSATEIVQQLKELKNEYQKLIKLNNLIEKKFQLTHY